MREMVEILRETRLGMRASVEKRTSLQNIDNLPQSCGHNKERKIN